MLLNSPGELQIMNEYSEARSVYLAIMMKEPVLAKNPCPNMIIDRLPQMFTECLKYIQKNSYVLDAKSASIRVLYAMGIAIVTLYLTNLLNLNR